LQPRLGPASVTPNKEEAPFLHRLTTEIIDVTANRKGLKMVLLASTYDQSRFLKAQDLTSEKKFKIKGVTEEEVGIGKDKERKLVVWFTNDSRGLVLNRVNNRTMRGAFGDTCDSWHGKVIVVFPTMAEFRGEMKPALRVRIPPRKGNGQSAAKPTPPPAIDPAEIDVDDDLNDEIVI
jgi:hypothetical protein